MTRQLKSLSELASCLAAKSPKIGELVEQVNRLTDDDSRKAKSLLSDLGTLQEASRSVSQLMNQKSKLESLVGIAGGCLITEHMYLQVWTRSCRANLLSMEGFTLFSSYPSISTTFKRHRSG